MFIKICGHYFNEKDISRVSRGEGVFILVQQDKRFSIGLDTIEGQALQWFMDQRANDIVASYREQQEQANSLNAPANMPPGMSAREHKLYQFIAKEGGRVPFFALKMFADEIGFGTINFTRDVKDLCDMGYIKIESGKEGTFYEIIPNAQKPEDKEEKQVYDIVASLGSTSWKHLKQHVENKGMSASRTRFLLSLLYEKGLVKRGQGDDQVFYYEAVPQEAQEGKQ